MVIDEMAKGISLGAFAGVIGTTKESVYNWTRAHPSFLDAVQRARCGRQLFLEQKLLKSTKGAQTGAAIFALKNAAPDEWRDLKYTEHNHKVSVEALTDDQLRAIASGVSPADACVLELQAIEVKDK